MDKPVSELTPKILAYPAIERIGDLVGQLKADDSIDWAIEMIELGYESRALYMLASIPKPTGYFEIKELVRKSALDLGLQLREDKEGAIASIASYYVRKIANDNEVRESLTEVYNLCLHSGYEMPIYDFYLLYWAWFEVDWQSGLHDIYWPGSTPENIEKIVNAKAVEWLEKYKEEYSIS